MKHLLLRTLIAVVASSASLAHAEDAYLGGDVVFGHFNVDVAGSGVNSASANTVSGRLLAGYNFNQTWAIEGGYADFGTAKYNLASSSGGGTGNLSASAHAIYVAAKASVPLDDKFSLYAKLGVAHNAVDRELAGTGINVAQSVNEAALYAGVGGQYKLTDNVAVTLEAEHYGPLNSVGGETILVSTGLRYSF